VTTALLCGLSAYCRTANAAVAVSVLSSGLPPPLRPMAHGGLRCRALACCAPCLLSLFTRHLLCACICICSLCLVHFSALLTAELLLLL